MKTRTVVAALVAFSALHAACSSNTTVIPGATGGGNGGPGPTSGGNANSSGANGDTDPFGNAGGNGDGGNGGNGGGGCNPDPANYDIPGNGCDDDGDGQVDNKPNCDGNLPATGDAAAFAKAIGLCQTASGPNDTKWGVISAEYTQGVGSSPDILADSTLENQHGLLSAFGSSVQPREGRLLGVLSSGIARAYDSVDGKKKSFKANSASISSGGGLPSGYPSLGNTSCSGSGSAGGVSFSDLITVKLTIKAPNNAKGFGFDFDFYSAEWPEYVCSQYNDAFAAFLTSKANAGGKAINVPLDGNGKPICVNNQFFVQCTPNVTTGCAKVATRGTSTCASGAAALAGTGFGEPVGGNGKPTDPVSGIGGTITGCTSADNKQQVTPGGATGWLGSTAPIQQGEVFTLEFAVWDAGDTVLDSSVLVDNFLWKPGDTVVSTSPVH